MDESESSRYRTSPRLVAYPNRDADALTTTTLSADGSAELARSDAVLSAAAFATEPRSRSEIRDHLVGDAELELDADEADALVEELVAAGAFEEATDRNPARREWFEKNWAAQFYFHLNERGAERVDANSDRRDEPTGGERKSDPVSLPSPEPPANRELGEVLVSRRTRRQFDGSPLDVRDLATMLDVIGDQSERLFDVSLVPARVPDLQRRAYRYDPETHSVVPTTERTFPDPDAVDEAVREAAIQQPYAESAAVAVFVGFRDRTSVEAYARSCIQFGEAVQRLLLAAEALGYAGFVTAALDDTTASTLVGTDAYAAPPVYLVAIGTPVEEETAFTERVSLRPRVATERRDL